MHFIVVNFFIAGIDNISVIISLITEVAYLIGETHATAVAFIPQNLCFGFFF
jgi:hypothetical protein